ncbi:MAG: DUF192 domain-containing protein [Candidatus Pacebacteria bacterium]|nr:DUF192 domain-containing protein [Candidatus Paceibacterota bacterium]
MKHKNKILFSILFIVIFFLAGFFLISHSAKDTALNIPSNIKSIEIGGQEVKVYLALTGAEQEQGLSGMTSLAPNTGMLFVFNQPGRQLFWMPDMNFSIDIIWITPDMKIDYIEKNATPASYPATFGPGASDAMAQYVLEVPTGFSDQNNLKVGDSVGFTY